MATTVKFNEIQKEEIRRLLKHEVKKLEYLETSLEHVIRDNFCNFARLLKRRYTVDSLVHRINEEPHLKLLNISSRNFKNKFKIVEKEYMTKKRNEIVTQQFDSISKLLMQNITFKQISKRLNKFKNDKSPKDTYGFTEKILQDIYNDLLRNK